MVKLAKFLTILLLSSVSAVRIDSVNSADQEEDVDNMTEAQYKNYLMLEQEKHANDEDENEDEMDDNSVVQTLTKQVEQ